MGELHPVFSIEIIITVLIITYLLIYLHAPWSRVLLAKLIGFKLLKKFPAF
jgi:hypothetical protein